jgi:hypothetical protein
VKPIDTRIIPIDTVFDGHKFRSRLEARWAVFFKELGIKYEYEKEGFDLDGTWYLPDFWLPKQECWVEIKGKEPTEEESELVNKLAGYSGHTVYIFFGQIEIPNEYGNMDTDGAYRYDRYGWDNCYRWCECPICGNIGIEYEGRAHRLACGCTSRQTDGKVYGGGSKRLLSAYKSARQARFEYGEKGT